MSAVQTPESEETPMSMLYEPRDPPVSAWPARPLVLPVAAALALSGCVTVKAPDKPIVIELNVNIRQEVIYRLAADAQNTIESNQDIF